MRLRRTAFPTMRAAIANPRRGTAAPVLRANIAKQASAERRASRYTRSNSDFCRRRCAGLNGRAGDKQVDRSGGADARVPFRQSDACDLSRGAGRGPDDPLVWPCGHESRACAFDADCSVGTYASWRNLARKIFLESSAKTSTWWGGTKGGKGTQHFPECQARSGLSRAAVRQKFRASGLWITPRSSV